MDFQFRGSGADKTIDLRLHFTWFTIHGFSFPLDYNMASMGFYIQLLLKSVVIVTMSFIALFIGMAMKSSKATIRIIFSAIF